MKNFIHSTMNYIKAAMTIISLVIVMIGLCTIDIESLSLVPVLAFVASAAWLVHVLKKLDEGGNDNVS